MVDKFKNLEEPQSKKSYIVGITQSYFKRFMRSALSIRRTLNIPIFRSGETLQYYILMFIEEVKGSC